MKNISFIADDAQEKDFVKALKKNVKEYFSSNGISIKSNWKMVVKTIVLLSLYIAPFIVLLTVPVPAWLAFVLVVLSGFGIAGVGMSVMHDACHGAYSKKKWVNDLLSGTNYLLGANSLNWILQHNVLHHTYTNISGMDEDIDEKAIIRLSENSPLKKYHRFQHFYAGFLYGLMTLTMLIKDFSKLKEYQEKGLLEGQNKKMKSEYIKMIIRKALYVGVVIILPILITDYTWYQVLFGFFLSHWVASVILSFIFQLAHLVEGPEQSEMADVVHNDWYVHQLHTTANFARNNKILGWYVGGLNFQVEHHLFPSICHIHYPQIAPIIEATAKEYGIPYHVNRTLGIALVSHLRHLRDLGRNQRISVAG
jgi:linoleoyl-CoA desaturase|tara:strand:- start:9343 stop:10440 length:1098 start_codon:yes stop_codon:yes gene_type:complete